MGAFGSSQASMLGSSFGLQCGRESRSYKPRQHVVKAAVLLCGILQFACAAARPGSLGDGS